ncbi:hypothetical protein [Halobaculum magnesiiphilum]|uniref:Uncharacterized protein n=1 Tax=Halobaculum magnesiiphilum TaxID=1017351 RepID=A0A8T8WB70_9EURY|nr:hypothetical protein [Halobaculum magnesiiphilum]QZP37076.1 hypothetical protein K6T50_12360 [Halobaculum magnesiiphilum]
MSRRPARIGLALVLVVAMLTPAAVATAAAQSSVYEADTDHALTSSAAKDRYDAEGQVTGDVYGLNMTLTVADDAGDVGLSDLATRSTGRVFLRVDYNEEISRTVRFYLPAAYVSPQLKEDLESIDGVATADLVPTDERDYTSVTISFDGETSAVFAISVSRGAIADGKSGISDIVGNTTGIDLPSFSTAGAEWHYYSSDELDDNETDYIHTENATTIQYNAAVGGEDAEWVPVAACDGDDAPVCTYSKADHPNRTYLLATGSEPPEVRYRDGRSVTGGLGAAVNDAMRGVDSIIEQVSGWFGGA